MKVIIPVSHADVQLLPGLVKIIQSIGGLSSHDVTILGTATVRQQVDEAVAELTNHCKSIRAVHWEMDNNRPWPQAQNFMWQQALIQVGLQEANGDSQPWYFMELDSCPIKPGWMDTIERRYVMSGARFGGMVCQPKAKLDDDTYTSNRIIPGQPENIPYLAGPAIYPPSCAQTIRGLWRSLPSDIPWDMFLRYTITKNGICNIPEMEHRWRTHNYTEGKDGTLTCESVKIEPQFTDYAGTIGKDAVLVHGCKDTSLQDIILTRYPYIKAEAPTPPLTETPAAAAIKPPAPIEPAAIQRPGKKNVNFDRGLAREFDIKMANTEQIEAVIEAKPQKKSTAKKTAGKKSSRWAALA